MPYNARTAPGTLSVAICARCALRHPYQRLSGDGDKGQAMRVCPDDNDQKDPWKLPARQSDAMALRFARPDVSIAVTPAGIISEDGNSFVVNETVEDIAEPG